MGKMVFWRLIFNMFFFFSIFLPCALHYFLYYNYHLFLNSKLAFFSGGGQVNTTRETEKEDASSLKEAV